MVRVLAVFELAMNEMASQVLGGTVSQLQILEIYSFLSSYHALIKPQQKAGATRNKIQNTREKTHREI